MHRWLLPATLLLFGCPPGQGSDGKNDDTGGGTSGGTNYAPGCITVDGDGGYASINDAIAVASEGATIQLCAGVYAEAVVVDKAVDIVGGNGVSVEAPSNEVPFTITAAGASITDVAIESTRTGIILDGATDTTLTGLAVGSTGGWAISSSDAVGTVVADSTFDQPQEGGIEVIGGTLSISNSTITNPMAYAIHASDGAEVAIDGTTFDGTVMLSSDGSDGYTIYGEGATITSSGSTYSGSDLVGLLVVDGALSMSGDTVENTLYGVYVSESDTAIDGLVGTGLLVQGVIAQNQTAPISVSNTTITVTSTDACSEDYDDWDGVCGGLLALAPTVDVSGVSVSGYNNYGVFAGGYDDTAAFTMSDVDVSDVGRWGIYVATAEGTVSGASVTALREPEMTLPCQDDTSIYLDRSVAFLVADADLALDGVSLVDNAGWGISNVQSSLSFTGASFSGNDCAGMLNYQGDVSLTGSSVTGSEGYGGIWNYEGVLSVDASSFGSSHSGLEVSEYDDGTTTTRYEYLGYNAIDIQDYTGTLTVTGSTFTDGDTSLYLYQSSAEIRGNSWTDYDSTILYAYETSTSDPVVFSDNTIDDCGGVVAYAAYGGVEVSDVTVGTLRSVPYSYAYYVDDVLQWSGEGESYPTAAFYAYAYEDSAKMDLTNVSIGTAPLYGVYGYDATLDLEDVTMGDIGTVGYPALYASWSYNPVDIEAEGLSIASAGAAGISLMNGNTTSGYAWLDGVTIGTVADDGIALAGLTSATLADVTVASAAGDAVSSTSVYSYYYYDSGSGSYVYATVDFATALDIDGFTVTSAAGTGFSLQGGSATIANTSVLASGTYGLYAEGLTALDVSGLTVTSPGWAGVAIDDTYGYTDYSSSGYPTVLVDADTVTTLANVVVTGSSDAGITVQGGTVTVSGSSATSSTGDGLELSSTTADVQSNTFTTNGGYGMTCDTVTLSACASNDLSGNTSGTHSGCDDACAL